MALILPWAYALAATGRYANYRNIREKVIGELSMETLVWTRGRNMSLSGLNDRMMCPRCGNCRVNLIFEPPTIAGRVHG